MPRARTAPAPVLPGMFDRHVEQLPPPRPTVNQERDRLLERVADKAEQQRAKFTEDARAFVLAYLGQHGPTAGEKLSEACKAADIIPHDDRAFGPVYMALARAGLIEKVDTVRRERGHGTAGGNVWAVKGTICE